jgi:hypothetical protein
LQRSEIFTVCKACLFVKVILFAKTLDGNIFLASFFAKKRCSPLGNFFRCLWQHPEIFIVYVTCPEDDADKFFGKLFAKKCNT